LAFVAACPAALVLVAVFAGGSGAGVADRTPLAPASTVIAKSLDGTSPRTLHLVRADKLAGASASVEGLTVTQQADHVVDVTKVGVQPTPYIPAPEGAALGTSNAYMAVSPDVSGLGTNVIGTISSSFTPAENIDYYINGSLAATFPADVNGRLAVSISVTSGEGFLVFEAVGQVSGKHAGGVAYVSATAPLLARQSVAAEHGDRPRTQRDSGRHDHVERERDVRRAHPCPRGS
jgi:hypothetical protein